MILKLNLVYFILNLLNLEIPRDFKKIKKFGEDYKNSKSLK
jgi:hypothetical protein